MRSKEIIDDLRRGALSPALAARAARKIEALLEIHQLDQAEIVRLRRQIEVLQMSDEAKIADIKEGNRAAYKKVAR